MADRSVLAAEQRVYADARFSRQLLEAAPIQLVRDEHRTLLRGQLIQRRRELIQEHLAYIIGLRIGVVGREPFVSNISRAQARVGVDRGCRFACSVRCLPEAIDDPVTRHALEPRRDVLDGFHEPVRGNQLYERLLHDVLDLTEVGNLSADECPKPRALGRHGGHDPSIVLARCPRHGDRVVHMKRDVRNRKILFPTTYLVTVPLESRGQAPPRRSRPPQVANADGIRDHR